jgi:DNA-binding response OmpR family regulator
MAASKGVRNITPSHNGTMIDKKVLIIDDDPYLRQLATMLFQKTGAEVYTAADAVEGLIQFYTCNPSLIILDLILPETSGFEICRRIRQVSDIPIIMLTALNSEEDMLLGLKEGADDFLSKPFSPEVLLARAKAAIRRREQRGGHSKNYDFDNGHLKIDIENRQVLVDEKRLRLSPIEFRLLVFLTRHAGKVLTPEFILDNVWGDESLKNIVYVHVYVSHLRNKIEANPREPRYIQTIYGIGYLFDRQGHGDQ